MPTENVKFVEGAHQTYPQWDDITIDMTKKFKEFP